MAADVVRVNVSGSTTVLTWRLRSADGTSVPATGNWASGGTSSVTDTRAVALIDTADLYATYPALSAGATTVTVAIPGFAPMPDVPVTRG